MMFRPVAVMVVVIVVAASNQEVGLAAGAVYALAYTLELGLSLLTYFGRPGTPMRRRSSSPRPSSLAFPATALASTVEGEARRSSTPRKSG